MNTTLKYLILLFLAACNNNPKLVLEEIPEQDTVASETIDYVDFRSNNSVEEIKMHNDSINNYLDSNIELKHTLSSNVDYDSSSALEKAYYDYCVQYIKQSQILL